MDLPTTDAFLAWLQIDHPIWVEMITSTPKLLAKVDNAIAGLVAASTLAVTQGNGRLYRIPAERWERIEAAFEKLTKAAERRGIDPPEVRIVRQVADAEEVGTTSLVRTYYDVELVRGFQIPGEWRLVGTIDHTQDGSDEVSIAWMLPGAPAIPAAYLVGKPYCDHCRSARKRNTTYVVAYGEKIERVGRTCMRAYLGDVGDRILALGEIARRATTLLEESARAPATATAQDRLIDVLTIGAFYLRFFGYRSRREHGNNSTANAVYLELHPNEGRHRWEVPVTPADRARAEAALEWARDLPDETTDDYLYNIRSLAQCGYIEPKQFGLAVSILYAHRPAAPPRQPEAASPGLLPGESGIVLQNKAWRPKMYKFGLTKKDEPPIEVLVVFVHPKRVNARTDDNHVVTWWRNSTSTNAEVAVGDKLTISGEVADADPEMYPPNKNGLRHTRLNRVTVVQRTPAATVAAPTVAAPPPLPPETFYFTTLEPTVPMDATVLGRVRDYDRMRVFKMKKPLPATNRAGYSPITQADAEALLVDATPPEPEKLTLGTL